MIKSKAYSCPEVFELEQKVIFESAPLYIGHAKILDEVGSYIVPERLDDQFIFLKNETEFALFLNSCQHHHAQMLTGNGKVSSIICPFHRWRYDLKGELQNAPKFDQKPCTSLLKKPLFSWQELYFHQSDCKLASDQHNPIIKKINFDNYQFFKTLSLDSPYNWKIFIDNYLDDYHIPMIHPGLRALTNLDKLDWEFGENYIIQELQISDTFPITTSSVFNLWANEIRSLAKTIPLSSVKWMLIYPSTMIEVYPYMITISTLKPISGERTINHVDFFFDKRVLDLSPNYPEIAINSYLETAKEDDELCIAIHKGKKSLQNLNLEANETIHPQLEKGIMYFHRYLDQKYQEKR